MKKILKSLFLLGLAGGMLLLSEKALASEKVVLKPNEAMEGRVTRELKTISYEMTVDKTGYQNFVFDIEDGEAEKIQSGWALRLFDENNKAIYENLFLKEEVKIGKFTFAKGSKIKAEVTYSNQIFVPELSFQVKFETKEDENFEVEDNNAFSKASILKNGKEMTGNSLDGKDEDFYVYTIPENGVTKLSFEIPDFNSELVKYGWDVSIFSADKKIIYELNGVKNDVTFPEITFKKGTKLYLSVKPALDYNLFVPYWVDYEIEAETKKSSAWEREGNDSFSKATNLGKGKKGLIFDGNDVDYYVLKASKTKKYKLRFDAGDNEVIDYEIRVFVGNKGKEVAFKTTKSDESISFQAKKGQNIWIKIGKRFSFRHEVNVYELKVK